MGVVVAGPQRITYTGTSAVAGTGTTVAGKLLSPGTLTSAVLIVSGNLSVGAYQYKTTFRTENGESEVSGASTVRTITDVTAPSAPSASVTSGQSGNLT